MVSCREGGMVFKDRDESYYGFYRNGYVHPPLTCYCNRQSNKPWTEEQKHKILLLQLLRSSSTISCQRRSTSTSARTSNTNLTEGVPAILLATRWRYRRSHQQTWSLTLHSRRKTLVVEIQTFPYDRNTRPYLTVWRTLGHHSTLAGLTVGIAVLSPVAEDKAESLKNHTNVVNKSKENNRRYDHRWRALMPAIAEWRCPVKIEKRLVANQDPKNPICAMMMDSGSW